MQFGHSMIVHGGANISAKGFLTFPYLELVFHEILLAFPTRELSFYLVSKFIRERKVLYITHKYVLLIH